MVKSTLFLVVSKGNGKLFQPIVLEYRILVSSCPQTVFIQIKWRVDAINEMHQIGASYNAKTALLTVVFLSTISTGK